MRRKTIPPRVSGVKDLCDVSRLALRQSRRPALQIPTVALLFAFAYPATAQESAPAGPPVAFPQVTEVPVSLQSISGRFSSLSPTKRVNCRNRQVAGRVVSARLIMVDQGFCGRQQSGVLVNVLFGNSADASRMIAGATVTIRAVFKTADEDRKEYDASFLIAEKAQLVEVDPPAAPTPAFTSYMICQPPELDALAAKLGGQLCVQNTVVENLATTAPALEAAARAPANGETGDPNAIICRRDLERSDIHLSSIACARGSYWAWWQKTKGRDERYWTPAPP